jgi:hypothetical protein
MLLRVPPEYSNFLSRLLRSVNPTSGLGHSSDHGLAVQGFAQLLDGGARQHPHPDDVESFVLQNPGGVANPSALGRELLIIYRALHRDRFPNQSI